MSSVDLPDHCCSEDDDPSENDQEIVNEKSVEVGQLNVEAEKHKHKRCTGQGPKDALEEEIDMSGEFVGQMRDSYNEHALWDLSSGRL